MERVDGGKDSVLTRGDLPKRQFNWQPVQQCAAEPAGVSRGHSTCEKTFKQGRAEHVSEGSVMGSSQDKRRQPNIPQGSYPQEEAVNPHGTVEVPSLSSARTKEATREECGTDLMEKVLTRENLEQALKRVEANQGAPGVDGMTTKSLRTYLLEDWSAVRKTLLQGTYQPKPVRRVEIPKPDGGKRLLGIPTVLDRFIQQALLQELTPIFDPEFATTSFGFRPGHSQRQAVRYAQKAIQAGNRWVVDMDLEKFFDRVNHDMLMARIARKVEDERVLILIRRYLEAGVMMNGCCIATEEGTPQGGPLSPLLSNIMLDDLDRELTKRGHVFVRYADDCNIYVRSKRAGERVLRSVTQFVEEQLKLKVNWEKSAVDRPWKRKFLGFSFTKEKETRIRLAPKTVKRFKEKIRELTSRSKSQAMRQRVEDLNTYLMGWVGYYQLADTRSVFLELEKWLRRRLRMCYLDQWKKPKTRRSKLVSLGLDPEFAKLISRSRKGNWRLSNSPQLNTALGLTFWQSQGLRGLVERYDKLRCTA